MSFFYVKWTSVKQTFLKRNGTLWIILAVLLFLIGSASLYFYLPTYVESKIFPKISQRIGARVECKVRRIGLTRADFEGLRISGSNKTSVSIGSIQLDYSLPRLLKKHVDRIVISGLEMDCEFVDGKIVVPGFDLQKFSPSPEQKSDENTSEVSTKDRQFPVSIGSFEIRNAVLVCGYNGQSYRLPFDLSALTEEKSRNTFECILKLYPRDQELILSSKIDIPNNKASLKFHTQSFQLDRFADIAKFLPGLIVSGDMGIDGSSEIQLKPFQISKSIVVCEFRDTQIDYKNMVLRNSPNAENRSLPLRMEIGGEGEQWRICISSISSASPMPVRISDVNCNVQFSQESVESSGYFNIDLERSDKNQQIPIQIVEPLHTMERFSAKFLKTGEWEFNLANDPLPENPVSSPKDCKLRYEMLDISSETPNFGISGKGEKTNGTVNYAVQIHDVNIVEKNTAMSVPSVSLVGEVHYLKDSTMRTNAVVKFENAEVSDPEYNAKITGISGEIPFQWPCEKLEKKGKITAEGINWNKLNLGAISGIVYQKGLGIAFEGEHNNVLLPGLILNFNGESGFSSEKGFETDFKFSVPRFKSASVDFGRFLATAKGVSFGGELELDGDLCIDDGGTKCSLNVTLQNSRLELKEKGLILEGINHALSIPDLITMRSAQNQQFCFEKLSVGSLAFYDGKIEFQIESPTSFFIENCGLKWCNGHVYTHAMRVSSDKPDYNIVLYCDRLNLAEILGQFGIAKAEGIGTVSGRIPIKYEKGNVSFDNGFLYSAPGDGGIIHVGGMDALDASIPQNTLQYSQINFVNAVLKDFNYNWVRFLLTSKEDDLVLQMSLDGKPMNPLPFTYNKKLGAFSRIEATSKGGIYHPVHLDINLRLPLNKIMYYGKGINDIMNMKK